MTVETSVEWIHSILVPLDGTSESASALPVGRTMAKIAGVTLRIIHATERASPLTELRRKLTLSSGDMADAVLEQSSENPVEAVAGAVSAHPGTLIVMSTHGAGRPEGGLGSVASGLLQSTDSPLLLVHPGEELERWHLGRVLLTQDGTPEAATAFVPAVQLARGAKASLTVLHVGGRTERSQVEEGTLTPPRYVDQPQHEWPEWTQELLDRIRCLYWVPEEVHLNPAGQGRSGPGNPQIRDDGGRGSHRPSVSRELEKRSQGYCESRPSRQSFPRPDPSRSERNASLASPLSLLGLFLWHAYCS